MSVANAIFGAQGGLLEPSSIFGDFRPVESDPSSKVPRRALSELEAEFAITQRGEDGDDSARPNQLSRLFAERFILALSEEQDPSYVYFDDDGEAVLEWHPSSGRVGIVRISGRGDLRYALVRHGAVSRGTDFWNGAVPPELMVGLRRLLR